MLCLPRKNIMFFFLFPRVSSPCIGSLRRPKRPSSSSSSSPPFIRLMSLPNNKICAKDNKVVGVVPNKLARGNLVNSGARAAFGSWAPADGKCSPTNIMLNARRMSIKSCLCFGIVSVKTKLVHPSKCFTLKY